MPARPDDGLLRVRVQPRASRAAIGTWGEDGTLTVRVTAPPVEGRANAAVGALLATALGVPVAPVRWTGERLVLLDQTLLPGRELEREYTRWEDVAEAIRGSSSAARPPSA